MIPIFAIWRAGFTVIFFVFFLVLFRTYKESGNELVRDFSKIALFLGLSFAALTMLPLFSNLVVTGTLKRFSHFLTFVVMAYFFRLPARVYFHRALPRIFFFGVILLGLGVFVYNLFYEGPVQPMYYKSFIFYSETQLSSVTKLSGLFLLLAAVFATLFYILGSSDLQDKKAKMRGFLLGWGTLVLGSAGALGYAVSQISNLFWGSVTLVGISALAVFLFAIAVFVMKPEESKG